MLEDARSLMRCARMQAWATWLRPTAGVLRVDCLAKRVCNAPDEHAMLQGVNEACAPRNDTLSHLFSIYIHPSPTFKGYSRGSIFRGRKISPRIKVEWGHWSIVEVRLDATPSALLLGPLDSLLCLHGKPALVALPREPFEAGLYSSHYDGWPAVTAQSVSADPACRCLELCPLQKDGLWGSAWVCRRRGCCCARRCRTR